MKLTEGQQRPLWRMIASAWAAHCRRTGERVTDSKAKEAWRRELVKRETGFDSLTEIPKTGRHYVELMAALEIEAGDGISWQMLLHGAEKRPYIHAIGVLMLKHEIEDSYLESIARNVTGSEVLVPLSEMKLEHLAHLLAALKRTCAHRLTKEAA